MIDPDNGCFRLAYDPRFGLHLRKDLGQEGRVGSNGTLIADGSFQHFNIVIMLGLTCGAWRSYQLIVGASRGSVCSSSALMSSETLLMVSLLVISALVLFREKVHAMT